MQDDRYFNEYRRRVSQIIRDRQGIVSDAFMEIQKADRLPNPLIRCLLVLAGTLLIICAIALAIF